MSDAIKIVVLGKPVSWKRAEYNPVTKQRYVDRESENYRAIIREAARPHVEGRDLWLGPIKLSVLAVFAIPKSWEQWKRALYDAGLVIHKTGGIDMDNIIKAAKDALKAVVYRDDAQVVAYGDCAKIYGDRPRLEIVLQALPSVEELRAANVEIITNAARRPARRKQVGGAAADLFDAAG